ncbi:MAG: TetR/AcrR family transcriptional regulator [Gammaproteobacteria bacterium]
MKNCPASRVSRLLKSAYHHGDLSNALVDAGISLLEQNGNADFTLRDLAGRVGVSHAAPYSHFKDKNALLAAIAAVGFNRLQEALETSIKGQDVPAEQFLHMGTAYVRFGTESPALYKLMFASEELAAEHGEYPELQSAGNAAFEALTGQLRRMQQAGYLREGDIDGFGLAVWAHVHGLTSLIITGCLECVGEIGSERTFPVAEAVQMSLMSLLGGLQNPSKTESALKTQSSTYG